MAKVVVVCGPTASGKSQFAVELAKRFGGEVINADSMQVYRGMDIAVAMPSKSEMMGVKHHLFGIIEPHQRFSVAEWLVLAREKIAEVTGRSALPIVVGGTGLYISSLVDNIIFDEVGENLAFRNEMYRLAETHGNAFLLEKLRLVDSGAASRLHENNVKRVVRALETFEACGVCSSVRLEKSRGQRSPYDVCMLGLDFADRKMLYNRINNRVDSMISEGLVEEARRFSGNSNCTSAQAIGHKELFEFIKGTHTLESCIETLKTKTRNYAKRQLTWFRKTANIEWLFINDDSLNVRFSENGVTILEKFMSEK